MKRRLPYFCAIFIIVFVLYAPRSPAQIQPAANQDFQPPQLLTPENGSVIDTRAPEFFWTAGAGPAGARLFYRFTIAEIAPGEPAPKDLQSVKPFYQTRVRRNGLAYEGPPFTSKPVYAWQVRLVDANGQAVGGSSGASGVSTFSYFVRESNPPVTPGSISIDTQPLAMTGIRAESFTFDTPALIMTGMRSESITINTPPLIMTGIRSGSISIDTPPLIMTGIRTASITINTQPLVMTGIRTASITLTTQPLVMTGMRVEPITIHTDALKMTGLRDEESKPPVEGDKDKAKSKIQEALKKKPDKPAQKSEAAEGKKHSEEPADESQTRQGGKEKTSGDSAASQIRKGLPSITKPVVPGEPAGATGKSSLQQKVEAKKTTDKVKK
jgi:hypothetical protein